MPGIIVGIDGSGHSRGALEWAMNEAALRRAPLTVLTVQQAVAGFWGNPVAFPGDADLAEHARKKAQEETDDVLDKLPASARPLSVTVLSTVGAPAEEILKAGKDAEMIVVGSRGAGGFKKLLMGSVSTQVSYHANCPVVVIPATTS